MEFIIFLFIAYLFGSISFGYLVVKKRKGINIKEIGSGATGGTNVSRVLGRNWGFLVVILDILKAALPVWLAMNFLVSDWQICLVILAAVLGHIYPVFLKFKGGKGVSVTIGALLPILTWKIVLFAVICVLGLIAVSKISSFASLTFASLLPLFLYSLTYKVEYFILGLLLFVLIWYAHRENIKRIIKGTEKKSGLIL